MAVGVGAGDIFKARITSTKRWKICFHLIFVCLSPFICLLATLRMSTAPCLMWRPLSATWMTCCAPVPFPPDVTWPGGKVQGTPVITTRHLSPKMSSKEYVSCFRSPMIHSSKAWGQSVAQMVWTCTAYHVLYQICYRLSHFPVLESKEGQERRGLNVCRSMSVIVAWLTLMRKTEMNGESMLNIACCCQHHRIGHGQYRNINMAFRERQHTSASRSVNK